MPSEKDPLLPSSSSSSSFNSEKDSNLGSQIRFFGLFLGIVASFLSSLTTLIAKLLNYHAFNKALWKFQGVLLPSIPLLIWACYREGADVILEPIWPLNTGIKIWIFVVLFIRGVFGCSATIFQYYALEYIAIGDVSVISFTTPIFVSVLAFLFLKEELGFVNIGAAFLTLLGIGIISRPPILSGEESFNLDITIGVGLALGCMLFATFTYVALRYLKPVHYVLVTFFYGFYSVWECGIAALVTGTFELPVGPLDWLLAITLAGLAFVAQALFTLSLKYEKAGPIALIRCLEVPFTFFWQILWLGDPVDQWSLFGTIIILLSVLITGVRKWVSELDEFSKGRQKLKWLLK